MTKTREHSASFLFNISVIYRRFRLNRTFVLGPFLVFIKLSISKPFRGKVERRRCEDGRNRGKNSGPSRAERVGVGSVPIINLMVIISLYFVPF